MTSVAVLGLGAMGSRLARRLVAHGHDVVVWNRSPDKAAGLSGVTVAATPAEATRRVEAALIMVSDPAALRDVTEGPSGVVAGASDATTVMQMSTVGPEPTLRLASLLPPGTGFLDAPVLGSGTEVENGTLKIFVGGDEELAERWTPFLSSLGSVLRVGPAGAAASAKLVANATLLAVLGVLGEGLALSAKLGLPQDVAFDVMSRTAVGAQADRRRPMVENDDYSPRFSLALALKDMDLVLGASSADLRVSAAVRSWFAGADEAGLGELDYSAVLRFILDRS